MLVTGALVFVTKVFAKVPIDEGEIVLGIKARLAKVPQLSKVSTNSLPPLKLYVRHASDSGFSEKRTDVIKENFWPELGTSEKQVSSLEVVSMTKYLPRKEKRLKRVNPKF